MDSDFQLPARQLYPVKLHYASALYDVAEASCPESACQMQDAEQCTQQVQVTAFQSSQQEGGLLTPRASGAPDSPMARALAASAAGQLPVKLIVWLTFSH